ncbi:SDR family oxidoreductase [Embleya sp. NPDC050154]|uniref:SDR family oxidoreductase n=1 Tax=Embleya sp. NPDC050154 TaxID=3363988 RepID=UPI0037BC137F
MPTDLPIAVTGATGTVGRALVAALLDGGHRVRALVRDPETSRFADADGLELVRADLTDPSTVAAAARGCEAVFLVWPFVKADGAEETVAALVEAGIRRIAYLSSVVADDDPSRPDGAVEKLVEQAVPDWTFLRPHGFMANAWHWMADLRAGGSVQAAYGAAATAPIHEADLAAVAALALTEPYHSGRRYVLTGPAVITQAEQLAALAEATGLPLSWEELSPAAARERMRAAGRPPQVVDKVLDYQARRVQFPEEVLPTLAELTGRPGRTFATWAADHTPALRAALKG